MAIAGAMTTAYQLTPSAGVQRIVYSNEYDDGSNMEFLNSTWWVERMMQE